MFYIAYSVLLACGLTLWGTVIYAMVKNFIKERKNVDKKLHS